MDQQAQMQAIVDKLTGAPPETLPPKAPPDRPWTTTQGLEPTQFGLRRSRHADYRRTSGR